MAEMPFFDANEIPEQSFDPLPAADYLFWVSDSDIKTNNEGTQKVEVTMEVLEPEQYKGRKVWDSFTLESPANPDWAETGRKILATLCRAVGVMAPRDTQELHEIPFFGRVVVDQWNDGSLHNKVVARWSTSSQAPPQKKPKASPAPRAPQAGPATGYMPPQRPQAPQAPQRPQAPQQPQYSNPLYPPNHPAQQPQYQAPQLPPPGAPYPGQPQYQAPPQQYQQPAPQQYQPPGPPAWAQRPAQPQLPQQEHYPEDPSMEVPF